MTEPWPTISSARGSASTSTGCSQPKRAGSAQIRPRAPLECPSTRTGTRPAPPLLGRSRRQPDQATANVRPWRRTSGSCRPSSHRDRLVRRAALGRGVRAKPPKERPRKTKPERSRPAGAEVAQKIVPEGGEFRQSWEFHTWTSAPADQLLALNSGPSRRPAPPRRRRQVPFPRGGHRVKNLATRPRAPDRTRILSQKFVRLQERDPRIAVDTHPGHLAHHPLDVKTNLEPRSPAGLVPSSRPPRPRDHGPRPAPGPRRSTPWRSSHKSRLHHKPDVRGGERRLGLVRARPITWRAGDHLRRRGSSGFSWNGRRGCNLFAPPHVPPHKP